MSKSVLHIKNMVCPRCISAVENTFTKLNIPFAKVELGKAEVNINEENIDFITLDKELKEIGFELIYTNSDKIIEQIKNLVIEFIYNYEDKEIKVNFSDYLSENLKYDYSHISKIFSDREGLTIEKYIILQKIERVKELISYNQLNFSEIAFKLNYSSPAHLSKQFKEVTGQTLSQYKNSKNKQRSTLDKVNGS